MSPINYIILAHSNPEQLKRLASNLLGENIYIYIHIDLNTKIIDFSELLNHENIFFIEDRVRCLWGDYSLVKATLNSIKKIIADKRDGHIVLLSGHDYPLHSAKNIQMFFEYNKKINFIECIPLKEAWPNHFKYRIQAYKYHFTNEKSDFVCIPTIFSFRPRGILRNLKILLIRSIKDKKIKHLKILYKFFLYKKPPKEVDFFGGSQWWAIHIETMKEIIAYIDREKEFKKFFFDSVIPDEVFFQTAIMKLKKNGHDIYINPPLTYIKWGSKTDNSPKTLKIENHKEIMDASDNFLFARKFDSNIDDEIIKLIEARIIEDNLNEKIE